MESVKAEGSTFSPHVAVLLGETLDTIRQIFRAEDWGGLRQSHFRLLSLIPSEGISVTELAARLGMTKQGCGQFVTILTQGGQLQTGDDAHDRRVRVVRRTPSGDRVVAAVNRRIQQIEEGWAEQVGPQRYATFRRVMQELTAEQAAARPAVELTTRPVTDGSVAPAESSEIRPAAAHR